MPPIEIQVLEGVFSNDEKRQIIERVSDAFALLAGQTINAGTSVRTQEIRSGFWGKCPTSLPFRFRMPG